MLGRGDAPLWEREALPGELDILGGELDPNKRAAELEGNEAGCRGTGEGVEHDGGNGLPGVTAAGWAPGDGFSCPHASEDAGLHCAGVLHAGCSILLARAAAVCTLRVTATRLLPGTEGSTALDNTLPRRSTPRAAASRTRTGEDTRLDKGRRKGREMGTSERGGGNPENVSKPLFSHRRKIREQVQGDLVRVESDEWQNGLQF
jgi:hypothetical protein